MCVLCGVLAGIEGTFLRSGPDSKPVISIEMIQRSMAVKIDGCGHRAHISWACFVSPVQTLFTAAFINQLRSKAFDSSKVHSREKIRRGIRVGAFVWGYGDSRGTGPASRANDARGRYYES